MSDFNMGPYKPNPKGEYKNDAYYKYFDLVKYNGGSYLNIYRDPEGYPTIGILPEGQAESEEHWYCVAEKGDKGDTILTQSEFITIGDDGIWDISISDKAIVPASVSGLNIQNAYSGCCGMFIVYSDDLILPGDSDYSLDFDYARILNNQYYLYTFVCVGTDNTLRFIFNRTVINRE